MTPTLTLKARLNVMHISLSNMHSGLTIINPIFCLIDNILKSPLILRTHIMLIVDRHKR